MKALRSRYGASPLHLLGHLACFGAARWVLAQLVDVRRADNVFLWLLGAVVLHDLLFLPFYTLLDRLAQRGIPGPAVNFVRVPALLSGLLALCFFPAILGRNEATYERVAGYAPDGYLGRWLLVTAALFVGSALVWALRGRAAAARRPPCP